MFNCSFIVSDEDEANKDTWNGKWFPKKPDDPDAIVGSNNVISNNDDDNDNGQWHGKWFPKKPIDTLSSHTREGVAASKSVKKQLTMGILDPTCDDTKV